MSVQFMLHKSTMVIVLLAIGTVCPAADMAQRVCEVANSRQRPPGAPKASDVIMRTLRWHPASAKDPHDTMAALRDFHVSRLDRPAQHSPRPPADPPET